MNAAPGKVKYEMFSGTDLLKPIINYLLETSCITVEVSMKRFWLYYEVMGQYDPSVFLGIAVQDMRSNKVFAFKVCMK